MVRKATLGDARVGKTWYAGKPSELPAIRFCTRITQKQNKGRKPGGAQAHCGRPWTGRELG